MRPATGTRGSDRGAAVVDFVLVSVLVLGLFLVVVQVGIVVHLRTLMVASAAEGARYAANADQGYDAGAARARASLAAATSAGFADGMTIDAAPSATDPGVVEVSIAGPVPLVLPIAAIRLRITGHALEEAR